MSVPVSSICIVANELDYIIRNGDVGTYNWLPAYVLVGVGWRVHLQYCAPVEDTKALVDG